jgi:6-phosphogluconolactonase
MQVEVLADVAAVACRAAALIAGRARDAVALRGRCSLALSGGATPRLMLRCLAGEDLPWPQVHLFQVDERVAPAGHPDRNLAQLRASLLGPGLLSEAGLHAMPVEAVDLEAAAAVYAAELERIAGRPAALDLAHLGLGVDGHTASLVPGDPALLITDADVTVTGSYLGRRRMTLTYPALDRAACILWVVTGAEKAPVLERLCRGDRGIPAGRVRSDRAVVLADAAAAGSLSLPVSPAGVSPKGC